MGGGSVFALEDKACLIVWEIPYVMFKYSIVHIYILL